MPPFWNRKQDAQQIEYMRRVFNVLYRLTQLVENEIMPTLAELQQKANDTLAQVTAETDLDNAIAGVINDKNAQIADLKAQLDAAIAANDPAALQAVSDTMDNILKTSTSNAKIVSDAVQANTTPTPQPAP